MVADEQLQRGELGGSSAPGVQSLSLPNCRRAPIAGAPPKPQSGGGDMEEKGILLSELSCRTAAKLPLSDISAPGGHLRSSRKASAAVQLPEYTAGAARQLRQRPNGLDGGSPAASATLLDCRRLSRSAVAEAVGQLRPCTPIAGAPPKPQSGGGDMEEKGIALSELSCRTATKLPLSDFSAPGGHLRSSRKASAAVQLPEYTAGAVRQLRQRPNALRLVPTAPSVNGSSEPSEPESSEPESRHSA
ncbi:unnamed protein product [Boreogadus saida]